MRVAELIFKELYSGLKYGDMQPTKDVVKARAREMMPHATGKMLDAIYSITRRTPGSAEVC